MNIKYYRLEFYVPKNFVELVKNAVFTAGAGKIGKYDCCSWQTDGSGQFRPLPGSVPFVGNAGTVETVPEIKVETICDAEALPAVLAALRGSHPYETPAYQYWPVEID